MKYFNIQMAAHVSGLSTHTIRAWEKRYGALKPDRSDNGRRQYSNEDIERLTLLSQLTNLGNSIGQIARLPDLELKEIYSKLTKTKESRNQIVKKSKINSDQTLASLLMALGGYKVDIISHELSKAKISLTPGKFALEILHPLLVEVNSRYQVGTLSMAQVHALYAIIKFHVGNVIYSHYEKKIRSDQCFALATPQNELNVFEIMISALLCCEHQQNFFYMSTNLPASSIAEGVNAIGANIIILGINQPDKQLKPINQFIDELQSQLKTKKEIWLVGEVLAKSKIVLPKNIRVFSNYNELDSTLQKMIV